MLAQEPEPLVPGISIRAAATAINGSVRLAREPQTNNLYILNMDGNVYRLLYPFTDTTLHLIYTSADHGLAAPRGMAFAPNGALYLLGNRAENDHNIAIIKRGIPEGTGGARVWTTVAQTEPYPLSNRNVDHLYNAIIVSPDGQYLYANAGSRTDHGEIQSNNGKFPGVREVPLTSAIMRVPADGNNLILPNNEAALKSAGYLFADGFRNTFDLAFDSDGSLFGTDNSGDRDDNEELNWIHEDRHYGFPWRMGISNTPQQYPGYDPLKDKLLNQNSSLVTREFFYNDPTYPSPPSGVKFTDPVINDGSDAVSYRDSADGQVKAQNTSNGSFRGFTPHRSPLGLVFDAGDELPEFFQGNGFMLSWNDGTPAANDLLTPFSDPGQDLLQFPITFLLSDDPIAVVASVRIVRGFAQPIDAEIVGNNIYVLEFGGAHKLWEVHFSQAGSVSKETHAGASLSRPYPNPASGITHLTLNVPRTQHVIVEARDVLGNRVAMLHDGIAPAERPIPLMFNGAGLPSGLYMIIAHGESFHISEEMFVVR